MRPDTGRPVDPSWLNADDERAWGQLVDQLERIPGLLTIIDGPQLERYARYLVRWRQLETYLEKVKEAVVSMLLDKEKRQALRLLWNESRALDLHLKQIEEKFGLTPSARTRIRLWDKVGDAAASAAKDGAKNKDRFFSRHA